MTLSLCLVSSLTDDFTNGVELEYGYKKKT